MDGSVGRRTGVAAVIFDWAGTLVDFGSVAPTTTFVRVFADEGVALEEREARAPMGLEKRDHIRALFAQPAVRERWEAAHGGPPGDADLERLYDRFLPLQLEIAAFHAVPVPGVVDAIASLRERGIRIGSDTGYSRSIMDVVVPAAAFFGLRVDVVVTADDVASGRPSPDMALAAAARLHVDEPWRCVKVDDTAAGIAEGLSAGMWTVAVAETGNAMGVSYDEWIELGDADREARLAAARASLGKAGAHYLLDTAAQIDAVVEQIEGRLAQGNRP